ncbi:MAG: hypothetical protein JEZ00_16785 [Anaerolineaceae bacterium]|nr:hypothetical protein [Anaerolineaceae bacterium]
MLIDLHRILIDGAIYSLIASLFVVISLWAAPRMWLHDYPQDIQEMVPPKTNKEKQLSLIIGIPFLILLFAGPFLSALIFKLQAMLATSFFSLFIHAFAVGICFNLVDWLILDWLMFCTLTPEFLVISGTKGAKGYKNYAFHFRGFLIGTAISVAAALIIAGLLFIL